MRQYALGGVVYLLTLGLTSGALGVLNGLDAAPPRWLELAVLIVASIAATVSRYLAFALLGLRTRVARAASAGHRDSHGGAAQWPLKRRDL